MIRRGNGKDTLALGSVVLLAIVSVAAVPVTAFACGNTVYHSTDKDVQDTVRAERLVRSGRLDVGYQLASSVSERFASDEQTDSRGERLPVRLDRVISIATVRLGGAVANGRARRNVPAEERRRQLGYSIRALDPQRSDDPVRQARYAEALATDPDNRAQALEILRRLVSEDLMPDAWAFRTLAELERAEGNEQARAQAQAACESRVTNARRRAVICPVAVQAEPEATPPADQCVTRVHDPDSALNVRERPGARAAVVETIEHGATIEVRRTRGNWMQIRGPLRGWVWAPNTRRECPEG